jgi:hypothetical protein
MITRFSAESRVGVSHVFIDAAVEDTILHITINGVTATFPTVPSGELLDRDPDKQVEAYHTVRCLLEAAKAAEL